LRFFLCSIILFFIPYGLNQYFTQIKKKKGGEKEEQEQEIDTDH